MYRSAYSHHMTPSTYNIYIYIYKRETAAAVEFDGLKHGRFYRSDLGMIDKLRPNYRRPPLRLALPAPIRRFTNRVRKGDTNRRPTNQNLTKRRIDSIESYFPSSCKKYRCTHYATDFSCCCCIFPPPPYIKPRLEHQLFSQSWVVLKLFFFFPLRETIVYRA